MANKIAKNILKVLNKFSATQAMAHAPYLLTQYLLKTIFQRSLIIDSLYIQQSSDTKRAPGYSDIDFITTSKQLNVASDRAELARLAKKLKVLNSVLPIVDLNSLAIIDVRWLKSGLIDQVLYLPHAQPPQDWITLFGKPLAVETSFNKLSPDVISLISKHFLNTFKEGMPLDEVARQRLKIATKIARTFNIEFDLNLSPIKFFEKVVEVLNDQIESKYTLPRPQVATNEIEELIAHDLKLILKSEFAVRYKDNILDIWIDYTSQHALADWKHASNYFPQQEQPTLKTRWHLLPWSTQSNLWRNSYHYDLSMAASFFPNPDIIPSEIWYKSAVRTVLNDHMRTSIQDLLTPRKLIHNLKSLDFAAKKILKNPPPFKESYTNNEMWQWRESIHNLVIETI